MYQVDLPTIPDPPENPREAFQALLEFLKEIGHPLMTRLNDEYMARTGKEIQDAWVAKFGKKKKFNFGVAYSEFPGLHGKAMDESEAIVSQVAELKGSVESLLPGLAAQCEVFPGEAWNMAGEVYEGTYSSQGWGAVRYAQASADLRAQEYIAHGLAAKVEPAGHNYKIMVKACPLDIQIVQHKESKISLRDWVQACYRNGVNPRVFNPYLPYGYEQANGIY